MTVATPCRGRRSDSEGLSWAHPYAGTTEPPKSPLRGSEGLRRACKAKPGPSNVCAMGRADQSVAVTPDPTARSVAGHNQPSGKHRDRGKPDPEIEVHRDARLSQ